MAKKNNYKKKIILTKKQKFLARKRLFLKKKSLQLRRKLVGVKFKDTCFCPQKKIKLHSDQRIVTPRKPNSARRKVFWALFFNPFFSNDFVYLKGEGFKSVYRNVKQGLAKHRLLLVRNGLTKDLRGLKYKIIHGAQIRKFKFFGLTYKKTARSKYGNALYKNPEDKLAKYHERRMLKRRTPDFYKQERLPTNKIYY